MRKLGPLFYVFAAAITGSGTATLAKIAANDIPPMTLTLTRFLLGALIIFPFFLKSDHPKKTKNELIEIIGLSLLAVLNPVLFFIGIKYTTAIMGQMIYVTLPIITIIISSIAGIEKLNTSKISGLFIGLVGSIILIIGPYFTNISQFKSGTMGNLLIFAGACSYVLYTVLIKKYEKKSSSIELNFYFMATGLAISLMLAPIEIATNHAWLSRLSLSDVLGMLYIGIFGTGIYYLLIINAVKISSPLISSSTLYIQPVFSFIWSYFLLGECFTINLFVGGVLTLLGTIIIFKTSNPLPISPSSQLIRK